MDLEFRRGVGDHVEKSWKFQGVGGVTWSPLERKIQWGGGQTGKNPPWWGISIFWNHTLSKMLGGIFILTFLIHPHQFPFLVANDCFDTAENLVKFTAEFEERWDLHLLDWKKKWKKQNVVDKPCRKDNLPEVVQAVHVVTCMNSGSQWLKIGDVASLYAKYCHWNSRNFWVILGAFYCMKTTKLCFWILTE